MSEGIDQLKKVFEGGVAIINAQQALAAVDYKKVLSQLLDLDESEARELAAIVGILDLSDDAFEARVKAIAASGAEFLPVALRIIRLFVK